LPHLIFGGCAIQANFTGHRLCPSAASNTSLHHDDSGPPLDSKHLKS
jgi:hypothetical protein